MNLIQPAFRDYYRSRTATPYTPFSRLKSELYHPAFMTELGTVSSDAPTLKLFERVADQCLLNKMLYLDTKTWLPDDLLVKADKMTMAASVELRVPLLDFQVLEFAASLPEDHKVSGWRLKRILKAALAQSVPTEILERRKTGFPVPYETWMRTAMKEFVFDTLLASNAALLSYFSRSAIRKLLQLNQQHRGYAKEMFSLLVLELWHRKFVGGTTPVRATVGEIV
jgi:asparagine synthase (glutamine-hydrolysing)